MIVAAAAQLDIIGYTLNLRGRLAIFEIAIWLDLDN